MNPLRLMLDAVLLLAFFFLPWWALFVLVLPGIMLFSWYGEALLLGFALDLLYREPAAGAAPLLATLGALALLLAARYAKRGLRLSPEHHASRLL